MIRPEEAGMALDVWLSKRFTYHKLEEWRELISDRRVIVDGDRVKPSLVLKEGHEVEYHPHDLPEPPVLTDYGVVFEDEDYLVINKPPDLPCHPAGRYFEHTLWFLLRQRYSDVRLANRIDRETSGLILIGRSKQATRKLGLQFERRQVEKEYLCVVEGEFPEQLSAIGVLVSDEVSPVLKKRKFQKEGEGDTAETHFKCLGQGGGLSLVHCILHTGRLHQIRVTLCSLGYPIVGDKIYGLDDQFYLRLIEDKLTDEDRTKLRLSHQALHAWKLRFKSPRGEYKEFTAPLPADVQALLATHGITPPFHQTSS